MATSLLVMSSCCKDCATQTKKEFGVQLYSARELVGDSAKYAENHDTVFKALAEAGYTYIEAANFDGHRFYGVSPEQFKADLEAAGLKAVSSHTSHDLSAEEYQSKDFTEALKWWDEAIAAHKAAGMEYIVIPWSGVPETEEKMATVAEYFNAIGQKCAEVGIKLGYHNHSHEFRKVGEQVYYNYLIENTNPEYVFFQMDVYWAVMAQASPVDYFTKYPGRFKCLHIKDRNEIGQSGMVGFDAIFGAAETAGLESYIVELEQCLSPDILTGLKVSADYLIKAPFVKEDY